MLLLERVGELRAAGLDPLLIAPRHFHYSGLATGVLSGALAEDANLVDVQALAGRWSIPFIEGRIEAIDRASRTVTIEGGGSHGYGILSLNIGSEAKTALEGETVWPIKPLSNLTELRRRVSVHIAEQGDCPRIVVAGAGPSGTEIAAALAGLAERHGAAPRITLVGSPAGDGTGWINLYRQLAERGVTFLANSEVEAVEQGSAKLSLGTEIPCDILVAATGLRPNPLARSLDVEHGERGGIAIGATLQSPSDPTLFATGDSADFLPRKLPELGVFGVRQAPVLAHNLMALARGEPLQPYEPQRRWLSILDLGNGEGFATRGRFTHRSPAALALKRRLDFAFVRRFQGFAAPDGTG